MVYLVLQKDQVHVPESACGRLCHDGIRIAYCKVYYPLAYYAAYFSIRATAFSYELMCMGKERLEYYMAEIRKKVIQHLKKNWIP